MRVHSKRLPILIAVGMLTMAGGLARAQSVPAGSAAASGDAGPASSELKFEPPPMPGFMLRPPDQPLSTEEMLRQAEEAAARVREPAMPDAPAIRSVPGDSRDAKSVK